MNEKQFTGIIFFLMSWFLIIVIFYSVSLHQIDKQIDELINYKQEESICFLQDQRYPGHPMNTSTDALPKVKRIFFNCDQF